MVDGSAGAGVRDVGVIHMKIFEAVSEDLTGLGGPMGTERISVNWRRYFTSLASAKKACLKDYNTPPKGADWKTRGPIEWERDGASVTSGDLKFVMYTITPIKIEN